MHAGVEERKVKNINDDDDYNINKTNKQTIVRVKKNQTTGIKFVFEGGQRWPWNKIELAYFFMKVISS